jgi:ATP-dependent RNA helicase DHX29
MAPKKKKTQLKPVARGFATTSVPKKVKSTSKPEQSVADQAQDAERLASQALVDKYQEKTEKDISR